MVRLVPKEEECRNLLVPVCISSSHIAFGSIRMEPVFMILAQSAATAAVLAIDEAISVQQVSYEKLKTKLLEDNVGMLKKKEVISRGLGIDPDVLPGIIIDGNQIEFDGEWTKKFFTASICRRSYFMMVTGEKE